MKHNGMVVAVILFITLFLGGVSPTQAGNSTVTICDFANLSSAVATANSGGGTITFACSGTIIFSSELTITGNVTINGGGTIIFDGDDTTRFFVVNSGASLTLDGLTLQNGVGTGSNSNGGAILADGSLTITDSTFNYNHSEYYGGAIFVSGAVTITNSIFNNNSAGWGGAIISVSNILTITNSTFNNNSASDDGGATFAINNTLIITDSTFNNNSAGDNGGATFTYGTATITNSTFVNNSASNGGAISTPGTTTLTHNTFVNNSVNTLYIYSVTISATLTLSYNILSGSGTLCGNGGGTLTVDSTNFASSACGSATVVADLGLGTFDGLVVPLLPTSTAFDAYPAPCAVATDQLGTLRPQHSACDAGAVEMELPTNLIVTTCDFPSLSSAVAIANITDGTITFSCSGTIIFSSELTITGNVTINGGETIIFDGDDTTRFFVVNSGASLTLDGLTLQNGFSSNQGPTSWGGAIYATGTLTISNSTFSNNSVDFGYGGGAILATSTLTISNSTFSNNSAYYDGAIHAESTLTITDSTFSGNSAGFGSGAVYAGGTTIIINSTFSGNSAGYSGGAVMVSGTTTITDSTFSGNSAGFGGAVYAGATTTITNSTFVDNSSTGGGAVIVSGTTIFIHNTFVNNSPDTLYVYSALTTATLTHNILSGSGTLCGNSGGTLTVDSTNFANSPCGSATVAPDLGLDTFDGQLVPLLLTSPALNAYPAPCAVSTDQLGTSRPQGTGCDAGAIEIATIEFNEQQVLNTMKTQATGHSATIYPLVVNMVTGGMTINLQDDTGQIGAATISLTVQGDLLQIGISQTTGIFTDAIYAELPQLVIWTLDSLFVEAGISSGIRQLQINLDTLIFEVRS